MRRLALLLAALPAFCQTQTFYIINVASQANIKDRTTPTHSFSLYSNGDILRFYTSLASADVATMDSSGNFAATSINGTNFVTTSGYVRAVGYRMGAVTFIDSGGIKPTGGGSYAIDSSGNGSFGNLAMSGTFSGTHAQNVGTGDAPVFSGLESDGPVLIAGSAGTARNLDFTTGSSLRWIVRASNAPESGSNAGSNFEVRRYLDDGVTVDTPFSIARNTGDVTISKNLTVSGTCTGCGSTYTAGTGVTIAGSTISIGQAVGTGNSVTFNTITASVNSNLGIANASSLSLTGGMSAAGGAATIDSFGSANFGSLTTTNLISSGNFVTAATYVAAGTGYGFKVGGTSGLSFGAVQTLTVRNSSGAGTCTISVIGGIISASTC